MDITKLVGRRVFLPDVTGQPIPGTQFEMHQPKPEAVGKYGTITGVKNIGSIKTPIIKLDNGEELTGAECWWDLVKEEQSNAVQGRT